MAIHYASAAFSPTVGKCYEIHFGEITVRSKKGYASARIKVNGQRPMDWIDLDTGQPLDAEIAKYIVQAHREIACEP